MPARALLVRHGQTEWSRTGRHTGRTDVPLTETGRQSARLLGQRLKAAPWYGLDGFRIRTSPLLRAAETCALAGFGGRAETWDRLLEWDYGDYEGRSSPDIRRERPGWLIWRDGVLAGEALDEVAERADRVIAWVAGDERDVLLFAHGHFLRTLAARWLGLPPSSGAAFELAPASLSVLGQAHGVPTLERWNDTAHVDAGLSD